MKVLIFATDVPPLPGIPTSGTALRTYGFRRGFESLGWETIVCTPRMAFDSVFHRRELLPETRRELEQLRPFVFDHRNADALIYGLRPDLVFCGHWPAAAFSKFPSCPVIIDLAGPHLLERHYQSSGDHFGGVKAKLNALAGADYFVVSGRRQREYFETFLSRCSLTRLQDRIITAPMALSPEPPIRKAPPTNQRENFPKFLFAGIFLPWQDPSLPLRALVDELSSSGRGFLRLIGGFHPTYPVPGGVYAKLFKEIEQNPRVSRSELVSFEELNTEMLQADVAFDLMKWNLERELAVTIRTTTYLWSGLPVVYNNFSDLSDLIARYNAGWLVDPDSPEQIRSTLRAIMEDPKGIVERSQNARILAVNEFSWSIHARQIVERLKLAPVERQFIDVNNDHRESADLRLGERREVEQRFRARHNGLSAAEVRIAAHGESGDVEILLYDGDQLIAHTQHAVTCENEHFWLSLQFPPLPGSAGKEFRLQIRSTNPYLAVWTTSHSYYPLTGLRYMNKDRSGQSSCIRTLCTQKISL